MSGNVKLVYLLAVAGILFLLGMLTGRSLEPVAPPTAPAPPPAAASDTDNAQRLQQLEQYVAQSRQRQRSLNEEILTLRQRLSDLEQQLEQAQPPSPPEVALNPTEAPAAARPEQHQVLADLGLEESQISQLRQRVEKAELDRLYLRNQAMREGWINSARFQQAVREQTSATDIYVEALGVEAYDAFLFRSGRSNRVLVQSVISGSPAEQAGVRAGDIIWRYDGQRIFGWDELTRATASGTPDQTVALEVQRDEQIELIYLPRGPLGVRLDSLSQAPEEP